MIKHKTTSSGTRSWPRKNFPLLPPFYFCRLLVTCTVQQWQLCESESESRSVVSDSVWPRGLHAPWNSPGQNTGVGSLSLLQGIFPTQGLNPGLLHCRQILYLLSHKGSPTAIRTGIYWRFPMFPGHFLSSFQVLTHIILPATLWSRLSSPFYRWGNWAKRG